MPDIFHQYVLNLFSGEMKEAASLLDDNYSVGSSDGESTDAKYLFECQKNNEDEDHKDNQQENALYHNYKLGVSIALFVVLCVSASAACAQALGGFVPTFQLNMWRFVAQFLIVLPVIIVKRIPVLPTREHIPWIAATCLLYNLFNIFYYTAAIHMPLGAMGGISRTFRLIAVSLLTLILSNEFTFLLGLSVVMCTTGSVLIAQPEFMFHGMSTNASIQNRHHPLCQNTPDDHNNALLYNISIATTNTTDMTQNNGNSVVFNEPLGYALLLLSSVAAAPMYFIANKQLVDSSAMVVSFWVAVAGAVPSAVLMLLFEEFTFPRTTTCLLLLVGHAFGTGSGTPGNQMALRYITPVILSLISCLQVVFLSIAQYTFMSKINPGKGNAAEAAGVVIVFIGSAAGPLYATFMQIRPRFK